jgi:hypothetical protein
LIDFFETEAGLLSFNISSSFSYSFVVVVPHFIPDNFPILASFPTGTEKFIVPLQVDFDSKKI